MDCCRQEMRVYEGEGHAESMEDPNFMMGYIQQPVGGGGFGPQLNVMTGKVENLLLSFNLKQRVALLVCVVIIPLPS